MKPAAPAPRSRREQIVDSMAKKFADRGSVEQIIVRHRRKILPSKKALYLIITATLISMIVTTLVTVGVVKPHELIGSNDKATVVVPGTLDLLNRDLASGAVSSDEYVLFCKDYLNRYDSLPQRYKVVFSVTTSENVYSAIVAVWPKVSLRTRQIMLRDLPYIEIVQKEVYGRQQQGAADHGSGY